MTEAISYEQKSRQEHLALCFITGYTGSYLDNVIGEWDNLMASPDGRAEALKRLTQCAEPLRLETPALAEWVAARRLTRPVIADG